MELMNQCSFSSCSFVNLLFVLRIFGLLVMAILFLQSGLDKITDWAGNLGWLKGHFEKSPFRNIVPLVLGVLTLQEVLAGILCLVGMFLYAFTGQSLTAVIGLIVGLSAFVSLFLGQRLAKDYAGAGGLVPYMIFNAGVLYLFYVV